MSQRPHLVAVVAALALSGCQSCPQAGTYTGYTGKLGTATLIVNCDGTLNDQYGPLAAKGTWVAVSDGVIKATLDVVKIARADANVDANHAFGTDKVVKYYRLDANTHAFTWDYSPEKVRD
jgi:hypothetical protein